MDGRLHFQFVSPVLIETNKPKRKTLCSILVLFNSIQFNSIQFNSLVSFIDLLKMHQIAQFQFPPLISFLDLFRRHFAIQSQSAL
jgi:hypothetical protein